HSYLHLISPSTSLNATPTTEIYTLSLHDALPISDDPTTTSDTTSEPTATTQETSAPTTSPDTSSTETTSAETTPTDTGSTDSPSDRKSTRLNSSHVKISYAVFCLKKKKTNNNT